VIGLLYFKIVPEIVDYTFTVLEIVLNIKINYHCNLIKMKQYLTGNWLDVLFLLRELREVLGKV